MKKLMAILIALVVLIAVTCIIAGTSIRDTEETLKQTDAFIEMYEGGNR